MDICITGHRPHKLWGYDLSRPQYLELKETMKLLLINNNCENAWTGMALGVDMVFALAVLELRDEGYPIKLNCAIPCLGFPCYKWSMKDKELYNSIVSRADNVVIVTEEEYSPYLMQLRNEYMVDRVQVVIGVWDGSSSGTKNCLVYATRAGVKVINIMPNV